MGLCKLAALLSTVHFSACAPALRLGAARPCPEGLQEQAVQALLGEPKAPGDSAGMPSDQARSVLTQHNDEARTGAYRYERRLNTGNVCGERFGKLFSLSVKGQIYAQPLYAANLELPDSSVHNVVFVVSMHNMVYAFDADEKAKPLWSRSLGNPVPYNFMPMPGSIVGQYNIKPEIGITATPVIDFSSQTIYLTAKTCERQSTSDCAHKEGRGLAYRIHALDLTTGEDRPNSPVMIAAECFDSTGPGAPRRIGFDAAHHLQRTGLLLANGKVYLGFGAHHDKKPYRGWVMAYDAATLAQTASFCSTPHVNGGGIWQAGNGLTADSAGNIYAMTGNGFKDERRSPRDMTDSFIKLSPDLRLLDWFAPANQPCLSEYDVDLGAAGPVLLPGTSLLVGAGKEGIVYLLDAANLGKRQSRKYRGRRDESPCALAGGDTTPPPLQAFQAAFQWKRDHVGAIVLPVLGYHHIHGSPVYYDDPHGGPTIFLWPERDHLRGFRFDPATRRFQNTAPSGSPPQDSYRSRDRNAEHGMPGGILSVSGDAREDQSNWPEGQPSTGIIWASMPLKKDAFTQTVAGVLRAYSTNDLTELWNSTWRRDDGVGFFAKYTAPTIANGKVYLATFSNRLNVYGLKP